MKNKGLIFIISIVLLLAACGKSVNETISTNPQFAEHISAHTSGVISKGSTIKVQLNQSLVGFDIEVPLPEELFSFEPAIEGKAVWLDNRTIEYIPTSSLLANQQYIANFNLGKLKEIDESISQFVFGFQTIKQNADVKIIGLGTYNETDFSKQFIEGTISFADVIDSVSVSKGFSVTQDGKAKEIGLKFSSKKEASFIVQDIVRPSAGKSQVKITFNGSSIQSEKNISEELTVYGQNQFVVTEAKVIQYPDQYVDVHFSDPVKPSQAFGGLFNIDKARITSYAVDGHHVKLYLSRHIEGSRELVVYEGIKNINGKRFEGSFSKSLSFEATKPNARKIGNGVIMPTENGLRFPFEAVNLKAVDVVVTRVYENNLAQFFQVNDIQGNYQLKRVGKKVFTKKVNLQQTGANLADWNKYFIDLTDIIGEEKGALYQIHIRYKKEYANYGCAAQEEGMEDIAYPVAEETEWSEADWNSYGDYYDYDYYDYDYDYTQRDNPCHGMYYRNAGFKTNFLLSDIGLIAKAGSDKVLNIFANDIKSTEPLSGVSIDIYNFQQQVIGTVSTDGDGMASINLDEKPFMIIAKRSEQRGYLKLKDGEALSLSKFDIAGASVQKGIKGMIYGERGVWRPGDSLFLTFMMEDREKIIPVGHPIEFKFYNSRNQLVTRRISSVNNGGFYDFKTATDEDAPTGNYRVQVTIGNRNFTKYLKIETVKPNRLKINLTSNAEVLSKFGNNSMNMNVKWLHGAPAGNMKAKVDVSVDQAGTSFDGFKDYVFDDPTKRFNSSDLTIFNNQLDASGNASFPVKLNINRAAPGMLNAHFSTKVFEEGGNFSVDQKSMRYSPYTSYVGVQVPKGNMYAGTLETGKQHQFKLASVTENGKALSKRVEVKVYKIKWRWWWDNYDGDLASYISRSSTIPVYTNTISTSNGKGQFKTQFDEYGRYLVIATDKESGHATGSIFYADEPYWSRSNRTDNEFATMLAFSTDKEAYKVGEEVKVTFPSSANGRALISIESGTKIISKRWIKTEEGATKDFFKVTPEMAPNVFVNITLLQAHKETANDLPIRMYGIVPIQVENEDSHLEPIINMPEVLRPESTTTIKIKEKNNKPMSYTLAIVDEGLLDLTAYKTPNPWNRFYAREALGVKTWDLYDDIMNAYSLEMDKVLATGGGGDLRAGNKPAKANRFKPMVRFVGPFTLPSGTAQHKIKIPNYNGSVRVMVVAGEQLRYGHAEKTVPVKNPLMVLGTLPRVVGPQEDIALPVNVFANEKKIKNVSVTVKVNDMFELANGKQSVSFSDIGDEVLNFKLKAKNKIGIGKVEIYATSGGYKAKDIIEIDVRPSNPKVTDVTEAIVQAGDEWMNDFAFKGVEGTNKVSIEVSSIPPINLDKRLRYLVQYPHGCIEQTTSSVFPQLYLANVMELSTAKKSEIDQNIKNGIERLKKFQTTSGGFSYWPGQVEDNEWGTIYGTHFLLEAEKKGYALPHGMKNKLINYMSKKAKVWKKASNASKYYSSYSNNDMVQAYRLYVLALGGSAEQSSMNRLRETKGISLSAKWRLAGAYQLLKQTKAANNLIFSVPTEVTANANYYRYSYGSSLRDEAMILEVLSLMDDKVKAATMAKKVAEELSRDQWLSTQTTAYSLIAMSKFMENNKASDRLTFSYAFNNGKMISENTTKPMVQASLNKVGKDGGNVKIKNSGKGLLYVRLLTEGIPAVGDQSRKSSNLTMNVTYLTTNDKPLNPVNIKQGTDFKVKVSVFNSGIKGDVNDMALTQIFPSGWEIHNTRMNSYFGRGNKTYFDYQDIRDDRINTYFSLRKGKTKTFEFNLNATYQGKFYMPTVLCEAMYDATVSAREPGKWVEVVK